MPALISNKVSVDNSTLDYNGSNQLEIKTNSVTDVQIQAGTIVQANMAILNPTSAGPASSNTTSTSFTASSLAHPITNNGGAVLIAIVGGTLDINSVTTGPQGSYRIFASKGLSTHTVGSSSDFNQAFAGDYRIPAGCLTCVDTQVTGINQGTWTYTLEYLAGAGTSTTVAITNVSMILVEL